MAGEKFGDDSEATDEVLRWPHEQAAGLRHRRQEARPQTQEMH
jgi:hypothetical protein